MLSVLDEIGEQKGGKRNVWAKRKIRDLATAVEDGFLSPSAFDESIENLVGLGYLGTSAGMRLTSALTCQALNEPRELGEFETLAKLIGTLPASFSKPDLDVARQAYSDFAEQFVAEQDDNDPENIRNDVSRIEEVGDVLGVDTSAERETLRERADELENEQARPWEDDDDRRGGGNSDYCSDGDLDSMFGTLKD